MWALNPMMCPYKGRAEEFKTDSKGEDRGKGEAT